MVNRLPERDGLSAAARIVLDAIRVLTDGPDEALDLLPNRGSDHADASSGTEKSSGVDESSGGISNNIAAAANPAGLRAPSGTNFQVRGAARGRARVQRGCGRQRRNVTGHVATAGPAQSATSRTGRGRGRVMAKQ